MKSVRGPLRAINWERLWRWSMIALGALILCSCRSAEKTPEMQVTPTAATVPADGLGGAPSGPFTPIQSPPPPPPNAGASMPSPQHAGMPSPQHVGMPSPSHVAMPGAAGMGYSVADPNMPRPYQHHGPWSPPGIDQPWPRDEYVRDGGDRGQPAAVGRQWRAYGVEPEDTVAHFDTLDGRTHVQPSNRVHIYAPRFGAVRQVSGVAANNQANRATGVVQPERIVGPSTLQIVGTGTQQQQPVGEVGVRLIGANRGEQQGGVVSAADKARGFDNRFAPYENLEVIRRGVMEASEMAWLARGAAAAQAWTNNEEVVVMLDNQKASAEMQIESVQSVHTVGEPPGNPRLRVIKVASEQFASPGDDLSFTLRFDNVGNQVIGNVTLIDNLSGRLEYMEDSGQCSLDARILTEPSESGSVVLRCEVVEPIEPGQGGILRFRCRVR